MRKTSDTYTGHMTAGYRDDTRICVASDLSGRVAFTVAASAISTSVCVSADKARELARMLSDAADAAEGLAALPLEVTA